MTEKPLLRWLKLNFSLVLLPFIVVLAGIYYITSLQQQERVRTFEAEAAELLESLRYYSATEEYLCSGLANIFTTAQEPQKLREAVEKFSVDHHLNLQFVINDDAGKPVFSNFPFEQLRGDYAAAYTALKTIKNKGYSGGERNIPPDVYANLRLVYGQHFFPRYFSRCFSGKNMTLRRVDAASGKPLLWLNVSENVGLSVFVPAEAVNSFCGVQYHAGRPREKLITGYVRSGVVSCHDPALAKEVESQLAAFQQSLSNVVRLPDHYMLFNFIDTSLTVFCAIRADKVEKIDLSILNTVILLLMLLGLLAFAALSYLVVVRGKLLSLRLKLQLVVLFVASNAMAGFVLYAIGSDYLQQFRSGLLNTVYNDGMAYLQSIDELFGNELTVQKARLDKHMKTFRRNLKKKGVYRKAVQEFIRQQRPRPYGFFLVASSTGVVAGDRGILKDEKILESFTPNFPGDKLRVNTMKAMFKIGGFILASLNKQPISSKAGTEAEMISETFTQQSPAELMRRFADRGSFSEWGVGDKQHPTYVNLLQLFDNVIYDYLLLYLWDLEDLEIEFVSRVFLNLSRNELGLRVMAVDEKFAHGYPDEILSNMRLRNFALKLRDRGVTRPETCDLNNAGYLLFGHKCVAMKNFRLLGLFPLEKIDAQVSEKSRMLFLLALVSLLISVSVSLFVAGGILRPLGELQTGVTALNERNFTWRVPDLGGDEFGHLARIFNETLVDLEELHVASQVQEKLLTQLQGTVNLGCLSFFCQTSASAGYVGDYFDLTDIDDSQKAMVFGRVQEHGVAGSLMLAFIKSATMQLHHLSSRPAELVTALNGLLISSSDSSRRKAMQIQGMLIKADGRVDMSCAGMPAALLFDRNTGLIKPFSGSTVAIGISGEHVYQQTSLQLLPGQTLILSSSDLDSCDKLAKCLNESGTLEPQHIFAVINACCASSGAKAPALLVISCA